MDKAAWEAVIPSMGAMALVRNLRNFDQAGVSDEVAARVAARISDPQEVRRSRQFPSATWPPTSTPPRCAGRTRWSRRSATRWPTCPRCRARTLVLVDRSGSMFWSQVSERSQLSRADAAAVFGTALALRAADADLVQFGSTSERVRYRKGESVLKVLRRFGDLGGTDTTEAVRRHYRGARPGADRHRRAVRPAPARRPHRPGPGPGPGLHLEPGGLPGGPRPVGRGNRHTFGGLSDAAFRMVPLLESGRDGRWPWQA